MGRTDPTMASAPWLRPPPKAWATQTQPWLRPPGQAPKNHSPSDCGMNCTYGAHTMVCRTTLRVIICKMSCALDAHMFVLRRTSKHNQPPHMDLSSAAPCQAAWPFSVTLRLSSVHQKATSWARRRCAQETTPPPSASRTHERTRNPLFRCIAWPFPVAIRLSSVHQKATWAKRRCAQETTPPPSASRTNEPTNTPLEYDVTIPRPHMAHTLNQLQNKIGIKPTTGNPPGHDVTKLHLHMTPHPFLHTRV